MAASNYTSYNNTEMFGGLNDSNASQTTATFDVEDEVKGEGFSIILIVISIFIVIGNLLPVVAILRKPKLQVS